jgi:tRNA pseudouridine55 synthase
MIEGLILMDKPAGRSTAHLARSVGKALRTKTGHAGTLDPLATGLVFVLAGNATKITPWMMGLDKEYSAVLRLGQRTDTADSDGNIIEEHPVDVNCKIIEEIALSLVGRRMQRPPAFSALKHKGKPLYDYARKGVEIEIQEREVEIHELEINGFDAPYLEIKSRVSSGTYIRSLAEEIGQKAGCGAHITELRRTKIGLFDVADALLYEDILRNIECGKASDLVHPMKRALSFLPEVLVDMTTAREIASGKKPELELGTITESSIFRLDTENSLVALLEKTCDSYKFIRVFRRPEEIEN